MELTLNTHLRQPEHQQLESLNGLLLLGGTDIATTNTFDFKLFESVNDPNVKDGGASANIIAPGTEGSVTVALENASEVNAKYSVTYTADEAGVPLQWSTDGSTWTDNILDLNTTDTAINMNATGNVVLHWKWAFVDDAVVTQTDADDTALGKDGTAAPTVTLSITAEQVD